jgi:hypothetical protein
MASQYAYRLFRPMFLGMLALASDIALGQTVGVERVELVGLPDLGVSLSGEANAPTIVNHGSRGILGYTLLFEHQSGFRRTAIKLSLLGLRNGDANAILRPGEQRSSSFSSQVRPSRPVGPLKRVFLDAVLFEDGEVAGPDRSNTFDTLAAQLKAERDLHAKLLAVRESTRADKDRVWSELNGVAQGSLRRVEGMIDDIYQRTQRSVAEELMTVRDKGGDDAAYSLAARSSVYPKLWRRR